MPLRRSSRDSDKCRECVILENQLAELLIMITDMQEQFDRAKKERDAYHDSCVISRNDIVQGNKRLFGQQQLITELKDKVTLYQETNQQLFEKCANVNDLEGQVKTLKARIEELEQPLDNADRVLQPVVPKESTQIKGEPDKLQRPSREMALKNLETTLRHIEELSIFLKRPLSQSPSFQS